MHIPSDPFETTLTNLAIASATDQRSVQTHRSPASSGATIQGQDFAEALYQTEPLVSGSSHGTTRAAEFVAQGTARARGLLPETAYRMVTSSRDLVSFITGPHPTGKTAEIVVAAEFRELHGGGDARMINSPRRVAPNVVDVRLSPDDASRRDLLFQVRTRDGVVVVAGGQVKTGTGQYVSDSLAKMAQTAGYGRTGYVDARFVNADGTPRIASDGFTPAQARRISEARVKLRGIQDLEQRARFLVENIAHFQKDGLDPVARETLLRLRNDIASAYEFVGTADRAISRATFAAATSAVVNLIMQAASGGQISAAQIVDSAGSAAAWSAGAVTAETVIYHAGIEMGLVPEAAQAMAQRTVAVGCCVIGIVGDVLSEINAVREGRASVEAALSAGSFKTAMGMLPLVMPTLGIGVPAVAALQIGGRWALAALRNSEASLVREIDVDFQTAEDLKLRMIRIGNNTTQLKNDCEDANRIFERVMGSAANSPLRLIR